MKSPEDLRGKDQIVVDKGDAEELLPGWTKEVKIRKIGSRTKTDRHYTDPVTGYTFHSFKDVQRYLKTGEVGKLATKPKANDQKDGICSSESKEQTMVPSPVSETSRLKRPLEFGSEGYKTRSKSSETSKFESPQRASKRLAGIDAPPLTLSEPKTRQATKLAGIKVEPFDAPPLTPSEPKTRQASKLAGIKIDGSPPSLSEPKTRQARRLAGMEIDASPPPALPEPKPRSARRLIKMETDAPTPPPPEPTARQAAQLAGTEIVAPPLPEPKPRHATRLAGTEIGAPPPPSPPEPKTRQATRLAGTEVGAPPPPEPKTRQPTRLAGTEVNAPPPPPPPPPPERKTRQATRLAEMESLPEPKTRKATRLAGIKIDASPPPLPEPKTRKATRLAGMKTDSPLEPRTGRQDTVRRAREPETRTAVKLVTPKENEKIKIAEFEKTTSGEMQVLECVKKITEKHDGNAAVDNNPNRKQEISILSPPTTQEESHQNIKNDVIKPDEKQKFVFSPKEHHKVIEMGPPALLPVSHTHTTLKEQVPPLNFGIIQTDDDKRNGKQELPAVNNPSVSNPIQQDGNNPKPESSSSSMNFCLNDFWTDPCIEFAVKTLTGAIPFGDLNKSDNFATQPLEVPLEELWTDPCIEFAVKTLTGAIPVGEEDYLQRQPSSSSRSETRTFQSFTLPDVGMNFCQTEVLSKHFETVHNKQQQQQQKQQDSVGNGNGNGILQKPGVGQGSSSSNINGQFFRGRLF